MASAQHHFSETGFHATSLRQIASTANVDLATVKYHYDDKLALYNAAFLQGHTRLIEHLIPKVSRLEDAKTYEELLDIIRDFTRASVELVKTDEVFVRLLIFRILEDIEYPDTIRKKYNGEIESTLTQSLATVQAHGLMKQVDMHALIMMLAFSVPMLVLSAESYRRLTAPILNSSDSTGVSSDSDATQADQRANGAQSDGVAPNRDLFSSDGVEKLALQVMETILVAPNA